MKIRIWSVIALALPAIWLLAIGLHLYWQDATGIITSVLGLAATLLIVGALRSRSRKSMYPH